jgi:hypothetical protein
MNDRIEVIGNISSVIDYNLNEQYSNVKKIILTGDEIISSFEDVGANEVFDKLSNSTIESYSSNLRSAIDSGILDSTISSNLYKQITEKLSTISDTIMDIQLQGYNFMNTVSNTKFSLTLRCETFSISRHYEERGSFLSVVRSLILDYLEFFGNTHRLKRLKNFQIEIYESEDIHKHIFLKKDGSRLILASNFGFSKSNPVDFITGSEFYFSTGEGFNFFRNSQTTAILREHTKLIESPIQTRDKILSDEELININNATKHISDAIIELQLTKKGKLKIFNLSVLENSVTLGSDNGFYINKSSKNYNRISLVTQRDNLTEEMPNPKYLLLRNANEIQSFLNDTRCLSYIDGIVLTENFYSPLLDSFGDLNDIDIIYHKNELNKSLDIELNSKEVLIGNSTQNAQTNPFNKILDTRNKEKDEYLEKLRRADLSTPQQVQQNSQMEQRTVNNITNELIASPNSSFNSNSNSYGAPIPQSAPGKKLSAIDMLMHAAENRPSAPTEQVAQGVASGAAAYGVAQSVPVAAAASYVPTPMPQSAPGKKLSAFDLLMHAAENQQSAPKPVAPVQAAPPVEPVYEQLTQQEYREPVQQSYQEPVQQEYNEPAQQNYNQPIDIVHSDSKYEHEENKAPNQEEQTGMVDHFAMYEEPKSEPNYKEEPVQQEYSEPFQQNYQDNSNNFPDEQTVHNEMLNREMAEDVADEILVETFQNQAYNQDSNQNPQYFDSQIPLELQSDLDEIESEVGELDSTQADAFTPAPYKLDVDVERYNDVISTKIITLPKIESNSYFVDSSNLGEITTNGDLFFLTPTDEDLTNDNLNYVVPLGVSEVYSDRHNYIVNSTNDFFLLDRNQKLNLFINLSYIDDSIKKRFLEECLKRANLAYVVCQKSDLYLVEEYINKLSGVFVKDLESVDELRDIEYSVLSFEKNYLMKHFN